jgi:glutamate-1-semialdehyde 2,1-aminomutase
MRTQINRQHLRTIRANEEHRLLETHKKSAAAFEYSKNVMPEGVLMSWMAKWPGGHPLFVKEAKGVCFTDVNGHTAAFKVICGRW